MTPDHSGNVVGGDPDERALPATVAGARGGGGRAAPVAGFVACPPAVDPHQPPSAWWARPSTCSASLRWSSQGSCPTPRAVRPRLAALARRDRRRALRRADEAAPGAAR